jgi:heme oxygenase
MDFAQRLRTAIADAHERIEALPLATAMVRGNVSRANYLELLGQLWRLHAALEDALAVCPNLSVLYQPEMARRETLKRDLAILGGALKPAAPPTRALMERFASWRTAVWPLVGALYVFEGSRMGSMVLAAPLAGALGVPLAPGNGLDYHLDGMHDRPQTWREFKTALVGLPLDAAEQETVVRAAADTMDGLCAVYAAVPAASTIPPVGALQPSWQGAAS